MTALKEFERLECMGLWRASPEAQRRDVIVSVGDATLTISDQKGVALTHWSLPAIRRKNPGDFPAIYDPGTDDGETLEISDPSMVDAIARVRKAIERRSPHPGRLRFLLAGATIAVLSGLAIFWLPGAMTKYAASVVPASQRAEIGRDLLAQIRRVAGLPCETRLGRQALDRMHDRLFGSDMGRIVVLTSGVQTSQHLPGHIILLNRSLVEDFDEAEVAAGFALLEDIRSQDHDPLVRLLKDGGLKAAFRLITTGDLPDSVLARHAENLLLARPSKVAADRLLQRFKSAKVLGAPYGYAVDITGETTIDFIEWDAVEPNLSEPVLSDGDWVSLQGICGS